MKKMIVIFVLFLFVGQVQLQLTNAENVTMTRAEIIQFLQDALETQLSLGEGFRSKEELAVSLSPYFTDNYQQLFIKEHLFLESDGYILYGSDFMPYFIPNYSYDENTKIMTSSNEIVVYEYFPPQFEGPVIWEQGLYEIITLIKQDDGWKIAEYNISSEEPKKHS